MLYKNDTLAVTLLQNIFNHIESNWDFLLIICGESGTGKSMFALNLLETWNNVILRSNGIDRTITEDHSIQVASDYGVWLKNFKTLKEYDMNIYDEGATTLDSKSFMTKIAKDISMLFDVFRAKKFFSVIVLPNFFGLNKKFREERLRGVIWTHKRGAYKFYTKQGVRYLNANNLATKLKLMTRAYPFYTTTFPDYKGVMLKKYKANKEKVIEETLDRVIRETTETQKPKKTIAETLKPTIIKMIDKGISKNEIRKTLRISPNTVSQAIKLNSTKEKK